MAAGSRLWGEAGPKYVLGAQDMARAQAEEAKTRGKGEAQQMLLGMS